ncbi:aromatic-ring-hydroxylating dioxygenase subunit beta [Saccharopolyspora sp. 5N708]|uniref:aromatic-ring-hydroxylating dioxygenase subunit beta n=1 Tax=Saccharopolyspora sp. 5N708 TaxID=3457424 RepID=UPI003FD07A3D
MTTTTDAQVASNGASQQATLTVAEAETLVFRECRLLDEVRYEEWLELFTSDGVYWIPVHDGELADARTKVSIVYDDAERRAERVFRTLHTPVLDQNPRSRTVHFASNIEVVEDEDGPRINCAQLIAELRPGGERQVGLNRTRMLAGRCEYRVRRESGQWRITLKKLVLIESEQPLFNLAFIL